MSPEQVKGTPVDARADIFSVGAVLYELLSHQQAFPGQVPDEVLHRILNGAPTPITEYCPDLDPRLVRLVERALEKDPDRRFQDIVSVQKELASIRLSPGGEIRCPLLGGRCRATTGGRDDASARAGAGTPDAESGRPRPAEARAQQHRRASGRRRPGAFDAGDYDAAIESCKQVLMLDASEERAISQIDRIHAAIDEQQIQARIAEARAQLSRGRRSRRPQSLDAATLLSPSHPEIAARARRDSGGTGPRSGWRHSRGDRTRQDRVSRPAICSSALGDVAQALALDPQNAEAQALEVAVEAAIKGRQEEARIRAAVDDARRRFVNGEHQAALQSLEALQPASNALVAGTLEELRLAFREIEEQRRVERERVERRRRITALLDDARAALKDRPSRRRVAGARAGS